MDRWKYYAVTHARHVLCNPIRAEDLEEVLDLVGLAAGARVLDVACGKGEWLVRCARRAAVRGVGVDASPFEVAQARARIRAEGLEDRVEVVEMDGARYAAPAGAFDLACCLGASWIFGGHEATLRALARWTRPGGHVLVAEPFWRSAPDPEYLRRIEVKAGDFGTHEENEACGGKVGLRFRRSWVGRLASWDEYEGLRWEAAQAFARDHPDDPDAPEILARARTEWDAYVRFGRESLGDALYLFQR